MKGQDPQSLAMRLSRLRGRVGPPKPEGRAALFFRKIIYDHFALCGRDFPWRRTDDPFHILVSEIMLQQTQTDRVTEKFTAFVKAFPDAASLARAPLDDVLRAWQGLGYNRRALYLHRLAGELVDRYGGAVPRDPAALALLPGIGRATASSIAAFAYDEPAVFIETNIRAVYIFFFFGGAESPVGDGEIVPFVEATLDRGSPRRWYSALMDYGVMLKKRYANPARAGAAHRKQPAFEGSRRQLRGIIVRALAAGDALAPAEMAGMSGRGLDEVIEALEGLAREGMVSEERGRYRLSR